MQCFVHSNLPASVVCKKCGKAMCVDCSAFANHSGLCPNCRKSSVEEGLRKLNGIKRVNIWVVSILCVFIASSVCGLYFLNVVTTPLVFAALAALPVLLAYLLAKLKRLRLSAQGLNANLAQIRHALDRAIPQTGVVNPLNFYQDVEACSAVPKEENWSQLAFIEPLPAEIPTYAAGGSETSTEAASLPPDNVQDGAATPATVENTAPDEVSDAASELNELQAAAGKLVAEDDTIDGQVTFREVIEELIKTLNTPIEKPAEPERPPVRRPRTAVRKPPSAKRETAQQPARTARPAEERPPQRATDSPSPARHKASAKPPLRPRISLSEEEKKIERERAEMRKELDLLRLQINELYHKTR